MEQTRAKKALVYSYMFISFLVGRNENRQEFRVSPCTTARPHKNPPPLRATSLKREASIIAVIELLRKI